jgi:hypothetical protein
MVYAGYDGVDTVSKAMLDQLSATCSQYSLLSSQLAAADGDREAGLSAWMESADNPQAAKLRTTIENAMKKLRELAEQNVESVTLTDEDKTKLQVEMDELKSKIKAGYDVCKNLIVGFSPDPEGVQAALDSIDNPVKSTRGRKPGSSGSSLPRVSATVTVTGGNYTEPKVFDSFSQVALALSVEVKDLQLAFAEAAGVTHENIKSVDHPVEFEFTPPHPNASTYTLTTTPKERKKPGPKGSEETPGPVDPEQAQENSESNEAA